MMAKQSWRKGLSLTPAQFDFDLSHKIMDSILQTGDSKLEPPYADLGNTHRQVLSDLC